MANPFSNVLKWVADKFSKDASKMLVFTGVAGWALSSAAQIFALMVNPKISKDQKSFLIPQEMADAVVNIGAFFLFTRVAQRMVGKLFSTGKIAPKEVRAYLEKHKAQFKDKVGKVDFDLDEVLKTSKDNFPKKEYYSTKNFGTAVATVGAGVISSSIITPLLRNRTASKIQKNYRSYNEAVKPVNENGQVIEKQQPAFKASYQPHAFSSGNMRI